MPKQPGFRRHLKLSLFPCFVALSLGLQAPQTFAETPSVVVNFRAGIGATEGQGIAVGSDGTIYATGQYVGTATFGTFTLTNGGAEDYYLAAYNPTGQVLWAKNAGTSGSDFGSDVIVDNDGNVVVVGVIQGTNDFHGVTNVAGFGKKDVFLAKYLPDGSLQWVRQAGSSDNDQVDDVVTDAAGNYFISGHIGGVANFGGINIGAAFQVRDFLAKYDSNGNILWARDVGSTDSSSTSGAAVDQTGNAIITGLSKSPAGPFVAKYSPTGVQTWKKVFAGNSFFDEISSASCDSSGNVYLAGRFSSTNIDFGGGSISNPSSIILGFVAKLDALGNGLWALKAGSRAFDVFTKADGTVYATGFYSADAANVGSFVMSANQGALDFYAAKIDSLGNVAWVTDAGTGGSDLGRTIVQTSNGNLFVIGEGGTGLFTDPTFPGGVFIAELQSTALQPSVTVAISGADLIVSWPSDLTGYEIETTTALGTAFQQGSVSFTAVPGETNVYSTPKPSSNLFIRLVKP
jgi:hypothetical protein